jgi:heme/copper-type cytochrome/quinol oxidase subunit 2
MKKESISSFIKKEIIIFSIIIILFSILIVVCYFIKPDSIGAKHFILFTTSIPIITIIIIAYSAYVQHNMSKNSDFKKKAEFAIDIQNKNWVYPFIELIKEYPESAELYESLFPEMQFKNKIETKINKNKQELINITWSGYLFQQIENYLITSIYDMNSEHVNNINFIQWLSSPILRNFWIYNYMNYNIDTQIFINKLINISNEYLLLKNKLKRRLTQSEWFNLSKNIEY